MRKKIGGLCCVLALLFMLVGCDEVVEEVAFHLTPEQQTNYTTQIKSAIEAHYWQYDRDSLSFSEMQLPEVLSETTDIVVASAQADYALQRYAGQSGVKATATLLHHNNDTAGTAEFLFVRDTLVAVYYRGGYDYSVYSLKERNPFLYDGGFVAYENWTGIQGEYDPLQGEFPENEIVITGKNDASSDILLDVDTHTLQSFGQLGSRFSSLNQVKLDEGHEFLGATFVQFGKETLLAVLLRMEDFVTLRNEVISLDDEGESVVTFEEEQVLRDVEKVFFYDSDLRFVAEVFLDSADYTCIASDDETLLLFSSRTMEFYSIVLDEVGKYTMELMDRAVMRTTVKQCHVVDIDGNGEKEYMMSDGLDFYMYQHKGAGLLKIWSTHLGVESLYGTITSGDLNGDGVQELYINDATGTTIRYILTEKGLMSSNADILYGQSIVPCDVNGDGLWDYWNSVEGEDVEDALFVATVS
ncbi:MAG: VCBS repeat-containing protein [Bacillota bacterium]